LCNCHHNAAGWLSIATWLDYAVCAGPRLPPALGPHPFLEYVYDVVPICDQERLSQQAPQRADGIEHRVFAAPADADDDDLAFVLSGSGQRRIGAASGGETSSVVDVCAARLLSREDPCASGSRFCGSGFMVWRNL